MQKLYDLVNSCVSYGVFLKKNRAFQPGHWSPKNTGRGVSWKRGEIATAERKLKKNEGRTRA